jgi:hypothetical protein
VHSREVSHPARAAQRCRAIAASKDGGVKERLEDFIRPDEIADDLVLLLRGGVHEDDVVRLQRQARDLDLRFSWRGGSSY